MRNYDLEKGMRYMLKPNVYELQNRKSLKQEAYQEIKNAILLRIFPTGAVLEEEFLAKQLEMSRTPVREALRSLEQDGLVTIKKGKGAFVSNPSWEELSDIFIIRETIEALAAKLAAQNMDETNIDKLESILSEVEEKLTSGDYESILILDAKFHGTINENCGNKKLSEIIEILTNQASLNEVKVSSWQSPGNLEQSLSEHKALLVAIRNRDAENAERLMKAHGHRFIMEAVRYRGASGNN